MAYIKQPTLDIDTSKMPLVAMERAAQIEGRVGVLSAQKHKADDFTTASLAAVHEFGSLDGHTPERSFFRLTEQIKGKEFQAFIKKNETKILRSILDGSWPKVLKKIAAKWEAYIHECFETEGWGSWEELADSTVAARLRKGNDVDMRILQDTGELEKHIVSEVK